MVLFPLHTLSDPKNEGITSFSLANETIDRLDVYILKEMDYDDGT
jgi:hypothetical protein